MEQPVLLILHYVLLLASYARGVQTSACIACESPSRVPCHLKVTCKVSKLDTVAHQLDMHCCACVSATVHQRCIHTVRP